MVHKRFYSRKGTVPDLVIDDMIYDFRNAKARILTMERSFRDDAPDKETKETFKAIVRDVMKAKNWKDLEKIYGKENFEFNVKHA